jgi:acyl-CoA reductase-like NAD-dependent aldehyde dehydrogenase
VSSTKSSGQERPEAEQRSQEWGQDAPTRTLSVLEPATEQVLAEIPRGGAREADAAVARAKAAYPAWRALAPADRSRLLHRLADALEDRREELATLEARNAGKPIGDARGEMGMVADTFRYYAAAPERNLGDTIPVGAAWP